MEGFHEHVVTNVPEPSAKSAVLNVLLQQLRIHRDALDVFPHVLRGPMTEAQRDASRKFQPTIQETMTEAYQLVLQKRVSETFLNQSHIVTASNGN